MDGKTGPCGGEGGLIDWVEVKTGDSGTSGADAGCAIGFITRGGRVEIGLGGGGGDGGGEDVIMNWGGAGRSGKEETGGGACRTIGETCVEDGAMGPTLAVKRDFKSVKADNGLKTGRAGDKSLWETGRDGGGLFRGKPTADGFDNTGLVSEETSLTLTVREEDGAASGIGILSEFEAISAKSFFIVCRLAVEAPAMPTPKSSGLIDFASTIINSVTFFDCLESHYIISQSTRRGQKNCALLFNIVGLAVFLVYRFF